MDKLGCHIQDFQIFETAIDDFEAGDVDLLAIYSGTELPQPVKNWSLSIKQG